ncbi:hypothetical protein [Mycolicibacterium mageritense]|uniref:hypothetical protein n=1 Tax=Mycolicibacterium mageritense TaxID=53462 RepID=UPI001E367E9F|nr:hypothetical protein [Mycolicibacterium mageritense]GJJ23126.1 hypothetical protein MTY414_67990 [Mycolicibacterium mageritense]
MTIRTLIGASLVAGAASLAVVFATPASADPTSVGCSPCARGSSTAAEDSGTGAPWTDFFANAPWEKVFDPAGDGKGAWERGVEAVNGGAWEKAFPPAE